MATKSSLPASGGSQARERRDPHNFAAGSIRLWNREAARAIDALNDGETALIAIK